jgi:hypothetical protein
LDVVCEGFERVGQLADEVTAYAAIEEFLYAGDGLGRGELGVDCYVAVFVFEECEFVSFGELGDQVEDKGWDVLGGVREVEGGSGVVTGLSRSQESGDDGDGYHGAKRVLCAGRLKTMKLLRKVSFQYYAYAPLESSSPYR